MERGPATTLIGRLPPGRAPVSPLESPHSGLIQLSISGRGSFLARLGAVVRPGSSTRRAGESPARVSARAPGSRPRLKRVTSKAERGVESLFGGGENVGCSGSESCSLDTDTTRELSRSFHGEGHIRQALIGNSDLLGPS